MIAGSVSFSRGVAAGLVQSAPCGLAMATLPPRCRRSREQIDRAVMNEGLDMNRTNRKLEEVASDLDDLSIDVDELKEQPDGPDPESLDEIADALDTARDAVDDIADSEG